MDLQLPQDIEAQLNQLAAAGTNINEFVAQTIRERLELQQQGVIENPAADHWAYGLNPEQLAESARKCDEGMQQFDQGLGAPVEEAMQRIADKHGFSDSQ